MNNYINVEVKCDCVSARGISKNEKALLKRVAEYSVMLPTNKKIIMEYLKSTDAENILCDCFFSGFMTWCVCNLELNTFDLKDELVLIVKEELKSKLEKLEKAEEE